MMRHIPAWLLCVVFVATGCGDTKAAKTTVTTGKLPKIDVSGGDQEIVQTDDIPAAIDVPDTTDTSEEDDVGLDGDIADSNESDDASSADAADTGPDVTIPPPDYTTCDAGHESWVKQALQVLLGRNPTGIQEVRVLVDLVNEIGRENVAKGLMKLPRFESRWSDFFKDELRINRVGDKTHNVCYGEPKQPGDKGEVASFVRDKAPNGKGFGKSFNMTDVLHSSLRLDDLSPLYMAHLFALMAKPITGANVAALEMDITRRQDFGEIFEATYLHRNVVCVGCHNSVFGTTDNSNPDLDHHWPLPGNFEGAIYGSASGIPEMTLYSIFRRLNVVKGSGGIAPWGLHESCGRFTPQQSIPADPAKFQAFFISELGDTASVWDTEAALRAGFDKLRIQGNLVIAADTNAVDGYEAFAYMVSTRIANQVWQEVYGYPLTLVHYFPRNPVQRDILLEITNKFVASQWSLKSLLLTLVTHDFFNENSPVDGCGPDTPYHLAQLYNPWSPAETSEDLHPNSVGDGIHRANARVLLESTAFALQWPQAPAYPDGANESFQKAIGVFIKDGEPGFPGVDFQGLLTWENRYGACKSQNTGTGAGGGAASNSCAGKCGAEFDEKAACQCDDNCSNFNDCCGDHQEYCVEGKKPPPGSTGNASGGPDWITQLIEAANAYDETVGDEGKLRLRDAIIALKDRLITEPDLPPGKEPALISKLLQVESLDLPLSKVPNWGTRIRNYCGVLVESPQFLLRGLPATDQMTQPILVVGNSSYKDRCSALGPLMVDVAKNVVVCTDDSLTIEASTGNPE